MGVVPGRSEEARGDPLHWEEVEGLGCTQASSGGTRSTVHGSPTEVEPPTIRSYKGQEAQEGRWTLQAPTARYDQGHRDPGRVASRTVPLPLCTHSLHSVGNPVKGRVKDGESSKTLRPVWTSPRTVAILSVPHPHGGKVPRFSPGLSLWPTCRGPRRNEPVGRRGGRGSYPPGHRTHETRHGPFLSTRSFFGEPSSLVRVPRQGSGLRYAHLPPDGNGGPDVPLLSGTKDDIGTRAGDKEAHTGPRRTRVPSPEIPSLTPTSGSDSGRGGAGPLLIYRPRGTGEVSLRRFGGRTSGRGQESDGPGTRHRSPSVPSLRCRR